MKWLAIALIVMSFLTGLTGGLRYLGKAQASSHNSLAIMECDISPPLAVAQLPILVNGIHEQFIVNCAFGDAGGWAIWAKVIPVDQDQDGQTDWLNAGEWKLTRP